MADQEGGSAGGGTSFLKSLLGIFHIVNILLLLIAWAVFLGYLEGNESAGRGKFFLFATITPWVVLIVAVILTIIGLAGKLGNIWPMLMAIFSIGFGVLCLISSALLADDAKKCGDAAGGWFSSIFERCEQYVGASAAFGLFSFVGLIIQGVLYVKSRS